MLISPPATDQQTWPVALAPYFARARLVEVASAFTNQGGLDLVWPAFEELLARGGTLRMFLGANAGGTEVAALQRLLELQAGHPEQVAVQMMEPTQEGIFHIKAVLLHCARGPMAGLVGSANLTLAGLTRNQEWMLLLERDREPQRLGLAQLQRAFQGLQHQDNGRDLTQGWLEAFAARPAVSWPPPAQPAATQAPPPQPHEVQREALEALAQARGEGRGAALVVMATGLGKTWLAAFDAVAAGAKRVLFVAHRQEILEQAQATFARIMPGATFGFFTGTQKDAQADVIMASVQTLGRARHRAAFQAEHFDYIVVDEFHHAAARTYRDLLEHFQPAFLLGLTATPMRRDGQDLLALCQGHVAYECPLWEGIERQLLSSLRYYGVRDPIDYTRVGWRGGRFEVSDLEREALKEERARRALEALRAHTRGRALAFCISTRHADYMAAFLRSHGVRAASVHSGEGSAPRAQSLDRLRSGQLEVLCAVDMFNEGVDVPSIDTVLMLRPTESSVIWLQQLGRGLRRAQGKTHLTVVDFIGNHKVFLDRPTWLLGSYGLSDSWETRVELIAQALTHDVRLPEGCEVHFDLELLETFLEQLKGAEAFSLQRAMLAHATGVPPDREALRVGQEVYRADIPRRFKYTFQSATWNQGFVVQERDVFLFVTLEKGDMQSAHQYRDTFLSTESFQWQSQNRTAQSSRAGEVIRDHARLNYAVHLWVRPSKKYRQQSVPFVYCGQVDFVSWRGEKPITVQWSLRTALTEELCRYLQPSLLVEP